jgi:YD repeat-containing protein
MSDRRAKLPTFNRWDEWRAFVRPPSVVMKPHSAGRAPSTATRLLTVSAVLMVSCGSTPDSSVCGDGTAWNGSQCVARQSAVIADAGPSIVADAGGSQDAALDDAQKPLAALYPGPCAVREGDMLIAKLGWDSAGRLVSVGGDETFTYDSAGRLAVAHKTDYRGDPYTETYTYASGLLTKDFVYSPATAHTNEFTQETDYTYDGSGRLVGYTYDIGGGSTHTVITYAWAADGHSVKTNEHPGTYSFDNEGRVTQLVLDSLNGRFFKYTGNRLSAWYDVVQGDTDAQWAGVWDDRGNLLSARDWNDNPLDSWDHTYVYDYRCWEGMNPIPTWPDTSCMPGGDFQDRDGLPCWGRLAPTLLRPG